MSCSPEDRLVTVAQGATGVEIEQVCAETGFSRFPVRGRSGDLLGYLHIKDVLETDPERRERAVDAKWIRSCATVRPGDVFHDAS